MGVLPFSQAVDIGLGRGRLARDPAASLRRVDIAMRSAFGRAAGINEAWRSPADADENYRKYLAYLNGHGLWAPIALPGDQSVHCFGYAVDTNDTSDAQMAIWNDNGWFWTVYRNGRLAERWHLEYFPSRDNHRNDPDPEEDDMYDDNARKLAEETRKAIDDLSKNLKKISDELVNGLPDDLTTPRIRRAINAVIDLRSRFMIKDPETGKEVYDLTQLTTNEIKPWVQTLVLALARPKGATGAAVASAEAVDVAVLAGVLREALGDDDAAHLASELAP